MKFTDSLCELLLGAGLARAHGLQGGSIAHVIDSYISGGGKLHFHHHEESAALAALTDGSIADTPGLLFLTTGPAVTNALTGVLAAWQDSVPLVVISGQTRSSEMSYGTGLRQIGSQEAPTLDLVRPIVKNSLMVLGFCDLDSIRKLISEASSGRPGPIWIDVPVDVQLLKEELG